MFKNHIPLFNLFGFKVGLDLTWFILAILITWSLAEGLFPMYFEGFQASTYWWMGVAGTLGLFISIVLHEFSHSMVAKKFGLPIKGITLFIFGGVSEMEEEPLSPKTEFLMAGAGPLSSVVIAGIFYLILQAGNLMNWPEPVTGVITYLVWLNIILAIFNMIPAFPLDGGRVLRSILWAAKKDLKWATKISAGLGSAFGFLLMFLGVLAFISGNFIGGIWYFLIGMFIKAASQASYQQVIIKKALFGKPASNFMNPEPITVNTSTSLSDLIEKYIYKYHYKLFPVLENGNLRGLVTANQVKEFPRDQWDQHHVNEITKPCSDENTISPDEDAMKALSLMKSSGNSRLLVVDKNILVGVITLKDMLDYLSLKSDFEKD